MNRKTFIRIIPLVALAAAAGLLASCETITSGTSRPSPRGAASNLDPNHPALLARRSEIRAEQPGNYYIGRRYWIDGTRFWGFVRRPGQQWDDGQLTIMNENRKLQPDRLPEKNPNGPSHGYDHNYEYKLVGGFTGAEVYDPNSNQVLPEFLLQDYEVRSKRPGFLFHPQEKFEPLRVPKPPVYR